MIIIKSLPPREISGEEALSHHIKNASTDELVMLKTRKRRAMRFFSNFRSMGLLRLATNRSNPYEQASLGIAQNLELVGRTACSRACGLCVAVDLGDRLENTASTAALQATCKVDGCDERGLEAVDAAFTSMPAEAKRVLALFQETPANVLESRPFIET